MIQVKVIKKNKKFEKITITGHAMYAELGKDIVCSAVSSIATTTINGILALNKNGLKYLQEEGKLELYQIAKDNTTQTLLNNMLNLLTELENNYNQYIHVN